VDEEDDDGDTALVGSLASRTGRGLGGDAASHSLVAVFLHSHVSAFRRSFFFVRVFLAASCRVCVRGAGKNWDLQYGRSVVYSAGM